MGRLLVAFIIILVFVRLLGYHEQLSNEHNENIYILKTCRGDVWCNYHNSRDTSNGFMQYVDYTTKEHTWITFSCVDSVIVLKENFWSCGPRDENLKYIDSTKN